VREKIAVITGASQGIGRAIAEKLASNGIHLILTGRDRKALESIEKFAASQGVKTGIITADLIDKAQPERIIRFAIKKFGRIDILINNAGIAMEKSFIDTKVEEWDLLMAVNARAPYFLCQHAIPWLKISPDPVIINISSVVGRQGYINQAAYGASKHALMGFTKTMAKEVHPMGIRVHVISPGGVNTRLVKNVRPDLPEKELIKSEEIANIVYFLISNKGNAVINEINVARASNLPWK
jgi:3-oxoacyl-[acyl-carrier protein] reductase